MQTIICKIKYRWIIQPSTWSVRKCRS